MVAAFEQSLSNMTNRLQRLTSTADQKDGELQDLREKIEQLKVAHIGNTQGLLTNGLSNGGLSGQKKASLGGFNQTREHTGQLIMFLCFVCYSCFSRLFNKWFDYLTLSTEVVSIS